MDESRSTLLFDETAESTAPVSPSTTGQREFQVFFDGECPLCRREIDWLRGRSQADRIEFVDLASADFVLPPGAPTYEELMRRLHGRSQTGEWMTGVEVIRRMYELVGLGSLVKPTRWWGIRQLCDLGYRLFAKIRFWMAVRRGFDCRSNACDLKAPS